MGIILFQEIKKYFRRRRSQRSIDDQIFYHKWGIKVKHCPKRFSNHDKTTFLNIGQHRKPEKISFESYLYNYTHWMQSPWHALYPDYIECNVVNRLFWFNILFYVFVGTGSLFDASYHYLNHLDEGGLGHEALGLIIESSTDESDNVKDIFGWDLEDWQFFSYPRTIYQFGCREFVSRCKLVKSLYCREFEIPYTWDITWEEYSKLGKYRDYSLCVDQLGYPAPATYLNWYKQQIQEVERTENALIFKKEYFLYSNVNFTEKDKSLTLAEEIFYYDKFLEFEKLKKQAQLKAQLRVLRSKDQETLVNYYLFWQTRWYNMIGENNFFDLPDDEAEELLEMLHCSTSQKNLKKAIATYIKLYRRDIIIWKAKDEFEKYYDSSLGPLYRIPLHESPFENEVYVDWLNFFNGNHKVPREGLLIPSLTPTRRSRNWYDINVRRETIERQYIDRKIHVDALDRYLYSAIYGYNFEKDEVYDKYETYVTQRKEFDRIKNKELYRQFDFRIEPTHIKLTHELQNFILRRSQDFNIDLSKRKREDWSLEELTNDYHRLVKLSENVEAEEQFYLNYKNNPNLLENSSLTLADIDIKLEQIEKKKKKKPFIHERGDAVDEHGNPLDPGFFDIPNIPDDPDNL